MRQFVSALIRFYFVAKHAQTQKARFIRRFTAPSIAKHKPRLFRVSTVAR